LTNYQLVLVNSGIKHALAETEYNRRRQECKEGVNILKKYDTSILSLRDVKLEFIDKYKNEMDSLIYDRCTYVIEENQRIEISCKALAKSDFETLGQQMYASHIGLKDKYNVSCAELDQLVEIAKSTPEVIGSRMMGGGFGGCTINLVQKNTINTFKNAVYSQYHLGRNTEIFEVSLSGGTHIL